MNTVAIPNIDFKVWTRKSKFPPGNYLCSLTPTKITRQIPFELTDIDYDLRKDEIARMESIEYNTAIGRNFMNVDDIEDFSNI